jgi:putative PEP-CTERM system TPR-repeat lipoprotein
MINKKKSPSPDRPHHDKCDNFTIKAVILVVASGFIAFPGHAAIPPVSPDISNPYIIKDHLNTPVIDEFDMDNFREEIEHTQVKQDEVRSLISQGVDDLQSGRQQQALDKLKQAWAMDPSLPVAGVIIANIYLQTKDYSTALEVTQKLQKDSPGAPEGYTLAGIAYAGLDNQKQALVSFEKALEVRPGDLEAGRNLAVLYNKQGNTDKARTILTDVLTHNPDHLQTINLLAELEFRTNRLQKAVSLLESTIAKHPNELQPRILLAQMQLATNQLPKALAILEAAMQQFPNQPELMQFAAVIELQNGAPDKALPLLESAIKLLPDNLTLHYNLALTHEQLKHDAQAMAEIDKALKLDPNHTSSKFVRARLMASTGELDAAQNLLKELEASNPESANIPELKGKISIAQKKPEEAINQFKTALERREDNPLLVAELALAQIEAQQTDAGYETLRHWIDKHPTDVSIRIILADLLLDKGRYDEAQKYYAEILKLQPDRIDAGNNRAWSLAQNGDLDEALDQAEKTYAQAPKNPWVMDTLATILLKKDQPIKATDLLRNAVSIAPDDTAISFHLAQALTGTNNDEAKVILKNLLSSDKSFKERQLSEELLKKLESE